MSCVFESHCFQRSVSLCSNIHGRRGATRRGASGPNGAEQSGRIYSDALTGSNFVALCREHDPESYSQRRLYSILFDMLRDSFREPTSSRPTNVTTSNSRTEFDVFRSWPLIFSRLVLNLRRVGRVDFECDLLSCSMLAS